MNIKKNMDEIVKNADEEVSKIFGDSTKKVIVLKNVSSEKNVTEIPDRFEGCFLPD